MGLIDCMVYVPYEEAVTPKQGRVCHVNRWWIVHPEKGLTFYKSRKSPQCNDYEFAVRDWAKRFPGHVVQQIPVAYI